MNTKTKIGLVIGSLLTAYAFGYYESPEKIKTVTQTVEVEKKTENKETDVNRDKHRQTTTTETTKPDGTKTKTTTTTEDTTTNKKTDSSSIDDKSKSTEETKEVTKSGKNLNISLIAGAPVLPPGIPVYGVAVTTSLIGPITTGLWGLSNGIVGASVGLSF